MKTTILITLIIVLMATNALALFNILEFQNQGQATQMPRSQSAEPASLVSSAVICPQNATGTAGFSEVLTMPIVAVTNNNSGVMSSLSLQLIPGTNQVLIDTTPYIEPDLQYSANTAVQLAEGLTHYTGGSNFVFTYSAPDTQLIGGGSAGGATAILTLAQLQHKAINKDVVMTGSINSDGTIGEIGGVMEKAQAVAQAGYKYFLIPKGQGIVTTYTQRQVQHPTGLGFKITTTDYVPKTVNLIDYAKTQWGLNVVEVGTLNDAIPYFLS